MAAYLEEDSGFFTRRGVVVGAILALHVFIAWALATGLVNKAMELVAPPIQTVIETETQKAAPPPPPPPPTFERPPVEIPPSDTVIELPTAVATTAISNTTTKPVAAAPVAVHQGVKVGAKPGKGFPSSEDYYPPASKRLNEEGSAIVHVCVGAGGKITEAPTIQTSSGSSRLDEGALALAKAGSGKYTAPTEDGKPITDCIAFKITFKMR